MDSYYVNQFLTNLVNYKNSFDIYDSFNEHIILIGVVLASSTIVYYYKKYTYWSRLNVLGPTPIVPFGTQVYELIYSRNRSLRAWTKKYGRVYGIYNGIKPMLVCSDAEIIREILVKEAHIFVNRGNVEFLSELSRGMLLFKRNEEWKQLRSLMAFTLTSGKIKKMYNLMKSSSDELINTINKKLTQNEAIDVKLTYGCFTIDVIARCAFALRFDNEESEQKYRKDLVTRLMNDLNEFPIGRIILFACLPKFILKAINFNLANEKMQRNLASLTSRIIKSRRENDKIKINDFLQTLMDLNKLPEIITKDCVDIVEGDGKESHHVANYDKQELQDALEAHKQKRQNSDLESIKGKSTFTLSDKDIISNCMLFLVAGYETTSSLLSFATYSLACHPTIQEQLYDAVKSCIDQEHKEDDGKYFEYETVLSIEFLDAVISETLRLFPTAPILERQANQDYRIASHNIIIKEGEVMAVPIMSVHYDPEYYPEPHKFNPSRFLPENRHKLTPYTYLPFGAGIRHCLGMRFALAEAKLALARLVYNFKFTPKQGSAAKFPPKLVKSFVFLRSDDLNINFLKR